MDGATCRICGRELTNPVSVEREIGPVCWTRIHQAAKDYQETHLDEAEDSG